MIVKKLSWASICINSDGTSVLIDPLGSNPKGGSSMAARMGEAHEPIYPLTNIQSVHAILITHIHPDHFDTEGILETFGEDVPIYIPQESAPFAEKAGFKNVHGADIGDAFVIENIRVFPTYSVDGFGTPQVAWIVKDDRRTLLHCGDTLWHGYWWKIEHEHGPIDAACLPVNGPILTIEGLKRQSGIPACLTPEEAVEAAAILGAKTWIPIHFRTFHHPPYYVETKDIEARVKHHSKEKKIDVALLASGEEIAL